MKEVPTYLHYTMALTPDGEFIRFNAGPLFMEFECFHIHRDNVPALIQALQEIMELKKWPKNER